MRWPMLEPYAGKLARTVLRGLGEPQGLPGYPTLSSNLSSVFGLRGSRNPSWRRLRG
jgi:hypothetical protein